MGRGVRGGFLGMDVLVEVGYYLYYMSGYCLNFSVYNSRQALALSFRSCEKVLCLCILVYCLATTQLNQIPRMSCCPLFGKLICLLSSQHPLCTTSFTGRSSKAHLVHINLLAIPINPPAPPPPIWLFIYILNAIVAAEFTALCLLAEESYHCKSARPLPKKPPAPTIPTATNQRKPTARARERRKKKKKKTHHLPLPLLLIKKPTRLRHRHTNKLILPLRRPRHAPTSLTARSSLAKHLHRLHGRAHAQRLAIMLLIAAAAAALVVAAVEALMRPDGLLLVDVLVLHVGFVGREEAEGGGEEGRFVGGAVGLGVLHRAREVGGGGLLVAGVVLLAALTSVFVASAATVAPLTAVVVVVVAVTSAVALLASATVGVVVTTTVVTFLTSASAVAFLTTAAVFVVTSTSAVPLLTATTVAFLASTSTAVRVVVGHDLGFAKGLVEFWV